MADLKESEITPLFSMVIIFRASTVKGYLYCALVNNAVVSRLHATSRLLLSIRLHDLGDMCTSHMYNTIILLSCCRSMTERFYYVETQVSSSLKYTKRQPSKACI